MKQTVRQLEQWVGTNQVERAIRFLQDSITDFRSDMPSAAEEINDFRLDVISLSSRYHDFKDKEKKGILPAQQLQVERRAITGVLLQYIGDLKNFPRFADFLDGQEEEMAWKAATESNSISAYEDYFKQYPEGKYKAETTAIIEELSRIQADQARRMKEAAAQERSRREQQPHQRQQRPQAAGYSESIPQGAQGFMGGGAQQGGYQTLDSTLAYILYVASAIIPIVGLGYGGYLKFAKQPNGDFRYDESSQKKGVTMMIVGGIFFLIYISGGF